MEEIKEIINRNVNESEDMAYLIAVLTFTNTYPNKKEEK